MAFKKPEPKKSKFKKCKCGIETVLWICPSCGKSLVSKDIKKEIKKNETNTDEN